MKKFILVFAIILSLSACSIAPKADAVRASADNKLFEGLDQYTKFSISYPASHSGPYESVDQLNFKIKDGEYKGKNATALLGQSRSTGAWEVLLLWIDENGTWNRLKKTE